MQCPPEIAEIVGKILQTGLLRIRSLDDLDRCQLEADHLHNLPTLLTDYKPELLDYYWTVERVCFVERSMPTEIQHYESLWKSLARHVPPGKKQALAG
jgi:hypothetical protein